MYRDCYLHLKTNRKREVGMSSTRFINFFSTTMLSFTLFACGGGSTVDEVSVFDIRGTVTVGSPVANATVLAKGADGKKFRTTTDVNGKLEFQVSGTTTPVILKVETSNARSLYSVGVSLVKSSEGFSVVNVTSLTDVIVRAWFSERDRDIDLEFSSNEAFENLPTVAEIEKISGKLKLMLSDAYFKMGIAQDVDLIKTPFEGNNKDFDGLLDSLQITLDQGSLTIVFTDPNTNEATTLVDSVSLSFISESTSDDLQSLIVNAGSDFLVIEGATVTLTGNTSVKEGDDIISYEWLQTGGVPSVQITESDAAIATFIAPQVAVSAKLVFLLRVTDVNGNVSEDSIEITVERRKKGLIFERKIAGGGGHYCSLVDGSVVCWGGGVGQLEVPSLSNPSQISAGTGHSCALDDSGVKCWGATLRDGTGSFNDKFYNGSLKNPTYISSGGAYMCAISDGGVQCWSEYGSGRDVLVIPELLDPIQVSTGESHACALDATGVVCWGGNYYGQLDVPPLLNPFFISSGGSTSCALDETGLVCWGREKLSKSLVNPTTISVGFMICATHENGVFCGGAQFSSLELKKPTQVAAIRNFFETCALDDTGVVCWGENTLGRTEVPSLRNPIHISTGFNQSCAAEELEIVCWGTVFANLGRTQKISIPISENVIQLSARCALLDSRVICWDSSGRLTEIPELSSPKQISSNGRHTCALDDTGVVCWGANSLGQTDVPMLNDPVYVSVSGSTSCAIDGSGVVCWGENLFNSIEVPELRNPTQLSLDSYSQSCAIDDSGLVCWGSSGYGVSAPEINNPIQLSSGSEFTCALADGGVTCWGKNNFGQLDVPALINPIQISAADYHACALDDTGVVCWKSLPDFVRLDYARNVGSATELEGEWASQCIEINEPQGSIIVNRVFLGQTFKDRTTLYGDSACTFVKEEFPAFERGFKIGQSFVTYSGLEAIEFDIVIAQPNDQGFSWSYDIYRLDGDKLYFSLLGFGSSTRAGLDLDFGTFFTRK